MQMMDVDKLVPHEKNSYFFDDMSGEAWMAFLESIETSGIIEPIVITESSHVIISGHQRVRAAKHFKMKQVPVTFREDKGEDEILKQLIETNIRQRGVGNTNPIKFGRCLKELERIYGIAHGGDRSSGNNFQLKTQDELAEELEMSKRQLANYKALADASPEMEELVKTGKITQTTAVWMMRKLSDDERSQVIEQIGVSGKAKVSQREIDFYTRRIQELSDENNALKARKPEVREVIKEVKPSDYELIQRERKQYLDERNKANARIKEMEEREGIHDAQMKLERESEYLETQINTFIRTAGGYVWITEKITDLPEDKRMNVIKAIKNINAWSQQMLTNIGGNIV